MVDISGNGSGVAMSCPMVERARARARVLKDVTRGVIIRVPTAYFFYSILRFCVSYTGENTRTIYRTIISIHCVYCMYIIYLPYKYVFILYVI